MDDYEGWWASDEHQNEYYGEDDGNGYTAVFPYGHGLGSGRQTGGGHGFGYGFGYGDGWAIKGGNGCGSGTGLEKYANSR